MNFTPQRPKREVIFDRSDRGGRKPQAPKKPAGWSHQNDLTALKGKRIEFMAAGASVLQSGVLLEADQFTVKIQTDHKQLPVVVFKSALYSFAEA